MIDSFRDGVNLLAWLRLNFSIEQQILRDVSHPSNREEPAAG